jgi:hypothetical protein
MSEQKLSAIWGAMPMWAHDGRMAQAALLLAGSQRAVVGRFLAEAAGRQAVSLRERARGNVGAEAEDLIEWSRSYWLDAIDYLTFAAVLAPAEADVARHLIGATGAPWPGDLEDLARAAMGIVAAE